MSVRKIIIMIRGLLVALTVTIGLVLSGAGMASATPVTDHSISSDHHKHKKFKKCKKHPVFKIHPKCQHPPKHRR
jgi:hypothetical protein